MRYLDSGFKLQSAIDAVSCGPSQSMSPPSTFELFTPEAAKGVVLDLELDWVYIRGQGKLYCRILDVPNATGALVCDLESLSGVIPLKALKFQFQKVSFPYAGLDSVATSYPCGIKSPILGAPFDVVCKDPPTEDRTYQFSIVLQTPGAALSSGVTIGIFTFAPGLIGVAMQQCCVQPTSPHVLDCSTAVLDVPSTCWFYLYKFGDKAGAIIQSGDKVMLESKSIVKYCSISLDGVLVCISALPSNATRNLFVLDVGTGSAVSKT
ncbi:hypothetical protein CEUSTIGMA_g11425.t1 [Chlamydomonas eustigma]|uniref:Uncharacterized protein n=1 Tax=Chlamydomonas eustigma TaxID=1157962 RepID=A0A250XMI5_9CHLO|nr:hypothetical protein CEUSTIGMA_g11425.t1 [Chlamydomonas eustigma]|eukprot:GAX84000.1 hypothetical protein CEUSTIGMA_g11425.t1 [Chlamydomonas eustigma]